MKAVKSLKANFLAELLLVVSLAFLCLSAQSIESNASNRLPHIAIGIQSSPAMALVMVAKDNGLFEKHGLDVQLVEFSAGKFALQAFFGGSLDAVGGGPEYFTHMFMKAISLPSSEVTVVSQRPEDMPAALASNSVDAVIVFDPFAYFAKKQLGDDAIVFDVNVPYAETYLLSVQDSILKETPEIAKGLLLALIDASHFIAEHKEKAQAIVAKYTKLDIETLQAIWGNFVFNPVLSEALQTTWQNELEWIRSSRSKGFQDQTFNPDILINDNVLKSIEAARVTSRKPK